MSESDQEKYIIDDDEFMRVFGDKYAGDGANRDMHRYYYPDHFIDERLEEGFRMMDDDDD